MSDPLVVNIGGCDIVPEDLGRDGLLLLQHKDCYKPLCERGSPARCSN